METPSLLGLPRELLVAMMHAGGPLLVLDLRAAAKALAPVCDAVGVAMVQAEKESLRASLASFNLTQQLIILGCARACASRFSVTAFERHVAAIEHTGLCKEVEVLSHRRAVVTGGHLFAAIFLQCRRPSADELPMSRLAAWCKILSEASVAERISVDFIASCLREEFAGLFEARRDPNDNGSYRTRVVQMLHQALREPGGESVLLQYVLAACSDIECAARAHIADHLAALCDDAVPTFHPDSEFARGLEGIVDGWSEIEDEIDGFNEQIRFGTALEKARRLGLANAGTYLPALLMGDAVTRGLLRRNRVLREEEKGRLSKLLLDFHLQSSGKAVAVLDEKLLYNAMMSFEYGNSSRRKVVSGNDAASLNAAAHQVWPLDGRGMPAFGFSLAHLAGYATVETTLGERAYTLRLTAMQATVLLAFDGCKRRTGLELAVRCLRVLQMPTTFLHAVLTSLQAASLLIRRPSGSVQAPILATDTFEVNEAFTHHSATVDLTQRGEWFVSQVLHAAQLHLLRGVHAAPPESAIMRGDVSASDSIASIIHALPLEAIETARELNSVETCRAEMVQLIRAQRSELSVPPRLVDDFRALLAGRFPVIVKFLTGRVVRLECDVAGSVMSIKDKLYAQEGIPPDQLRLIFAGRNLSDDEAIYGLQVYGKAFILVHGVLRARTPQ